MFKHLLHACQLQFYVNKTNGKKNKNLPFLSKIKINKQF